MRAKGRGFTLIELLVVLGIVALMLTIAVPRFFPQIDSTKEKILMENLRNTRAVIDQYFADRGRYPDSLDELVEKRYLPAKPYDPITESTETWILLPPEDDSRGSVYSIKSGAPGAGKDGRAFADW